MTAEPRFRVKVDAKRRPTLPQSLLDAAGVGGGEDLIAHLEPPGRIVLEGPATVLARLQETIRAGKNRARRHCLPRRRAACRAGPRHQPACAAHRHRAHGRARRRPVTGSAPPPPLPDGPVVLDASFVIALLDREAAAQRYATVLRRAVITSVTLGEVLSKLHTATGVDPGQVEDGLLALGVTLVDLPVAAARHFPALRTIDAARRAEQKATGEKAATLSLADLAVLAYALTTELPVLTGDRHWTTLEPHGLTVDVHPFRDPRTTP